MNPYIVCLTIAIVLVLWMGYTKLSSYLKERKEEKERFDRIEKMKYERELEMVVNSLNRGFDELIKKHGLEEQYKKIGSEMDKMWEKERKDLENKN